MTWRSLDSCQAKPGCLVAETSQVAQTEVVYQGVSFDFFHFFPLMQKPRDQPIKTSEEMFVDLC